ncbi:MAG TPA: response regulator transcription factor [Candidatus Xenobia bacterium]|jgi:DNA-binding NarL/FixJ family response regulator
MADIRIAVVDDHLIIRRGLRLMLEEHPEFQMVGEALSGAQALKLVEMQNPHVVLMDINLEGDIDGIETTRTIKSRWPEVQIIMITMNEETDKIRKAIEVGASGYLLKDVDSRTLAESIKTVLSGGNAINPKVSRRILSELVGMSARPAPSPAAVLSDRERQVLSLLFEGKSNQEIGDVLCITEKTVKAHMTSLLRKLGVKDRTQAVLHAMKHNLVEPRS